MANLVETPEYAPAVYRLERTDPADAGANQDGPLNLPLVDLANRSAFLKASLDAVITGEGGAPDNLDPSLLYDAIVNAITSAMTGHENAADPHPQYTTDAEVIALIALTSMPAGMVFAWPGATPPAGALALPLTATDISRSTYANLFAAIDIQWGAGDGVTTFGMPYLAADGSLVQANGNVGSNTVGEVISHTHPLSSSTYGGSGPPAAYSWATNGTYYTGATGGSRNLAAGNRFLMCVKY